MTCEVVMSKTVTTLYYIMSPSLFRCPGIMVTHTHKYSVQQDRKYKAAWGQFLYHGQMPIIKK